MFEKNDDASHKNLGLSCTEICCNTLHQLLAVSPIGVVGCRSLAKIIYSSVGITGWPGCYYS